MSKSQRIDAGIDLGALFDNDAAEARIWGRRPRRSPPGEKKQDSPVVVEPVAHPLLLPLHWLDMYEERAAIFQYDAGHTRDEAERLALAEINELMQAEAGRKQG